MRILIQPPNHASGARHVGDEVSTALEVLNAAYIKTEGGGTVTGDGAVMGVVVVSADDDGPRALEELAKVGIKASIG
jgi:hypothetical protein